MQGPNTPIKPCAQGRKGKKRVGTWGHVCMCVYIFMYVCIYVCMSVCMYTHIHTYLPDLHTYLPIHTYIHTYIHTHICAFSMQDPTLQRSAQLTLNLRHGHLCPTLKPTLWATTLGVMMCLWHD